MFATVATCCLNVEEETDLQIFLKDEMQEALVMLKRKNVNVKAAVTINRRESRQRIKNAKHYIGKYRGAHGGYILAVLFD